MRNRNLAFIAGVVAVLLGACSSSSRSRPRPLDRAALRRDDHAAGDAPSDAPRPTRPRRARRAATAADLAAVHVRLQPVVSGLDEPGRDRVPPARRTQMFVVEQSGLLRVSPTARRRRPPRSISRGNLSTATSKGCSAPRSRPTVERLYVDYTDRQRQHARRRVRDARRRRRRDARRRVLFVQQPYPNHNGGEVIVRPRRDALHRARRRRHRPAIRTATARTSRRRWARLARRRRRRQAPS